MSDTFKSLAESLGSKVAALESRAEATVRLARIVRAALPREVAVHVVAAACRADTLVVLADSGAWCAQIRYAEDALRRTFAAERLPDFAKLKVRVQAPVSTARWPSGTVR
jgi:hypothetical protein